MALTELIQQIVPLLFEDEHLLAVDKPAGVDVGARKDAASSGLVETLAAVRGGDERLEPINRLSRYESGILLLAKNSAVAERLRRALRAGRMRQTFAAVVLGRPARPRLFLGDGAAEPGSPGATTSRGHEATKGPREPSGPNRNRKGMGARQNRPHGPNRDRKGAGPQRSRRTPGGGRTSPSARGFEPAPRRTPGVSQAEARGLQGARTTIQMVGHGERRALVRCETNVETTHALRAQLRGAGLRLLGDPLHQTRGARVHGPEQTCLHLLRLSFRHPMRDAAAPPLVIRAAPTGKRERGSTPDDVPPSHAMALAGERDYIRPLRAALARRLVCLADETTDSYRLITGDLEDLPGLAAEKFGPVVVLQLRSPRPNLLEALPTIARWYRRTLSVSAVHVKDLARRPSVTPARQAVGAGDAPRRVAGKTRIPPTATTGVIAGQDLRDEVVALENGLRFAIRPEEAASVGLFLDQRENRRRVHEMARDLRVLNLFAYTCGFSVSAAAGGAAATTSVDLSNKHLDWARRNFELNGIDPAAHKFVRSDAGTYLKRAVRQDERFDLIIIDAPTFAHGAKRRQAFSLADDLPGLVAAAARVLSERGVMLISTNNRRITRAGLKRLVTQGAGGRRMRILASPALPPDFAIDPDHAKTIIARFE